MALGRRWGYLSPLAAGAGGLLLILGAPPLPALLLMAGGAAVLTMATLRAAQRQPSLHARILTLASALAVLASLAWLFGHFTSAIAGWIGFLVLTIAGERLELSRFMPPSPRARQAFIGIVGVLVLAILGSWFAPESLRLLGAGLAALAIWLLRQDVARRTVLQQGLTRFIAVCLLSGYVWLLVGGVLLAVQPALPLLMDAALHAIFVGFVLAMVFGHAPIIFPAIVRVALPYHVLFYLPLLVLHASLLLRVTGGLLGVCRICVPGGLPATPCVWRCSSSPWRPRRSVLHETRRAGETRQADSCRPCVRPAGSPLPLFRPSVAGCSCAPRASLHAAQHRRGPARAPGHHHRPPR